MVILQPRPGTSGAALLELLTGEERSIANARGSGITPVERLEGYKRWATTAVRLLGAAISRDDLNRLVTTPGYWALQRLAPAEAKHQFELIDLELDERCSDLKQARDQLAGDIRRWSSPPGMLVVADTNVYLHHEHYFDEIPWHPIVQAQTEGVRLVIPLLVVDELDRNKRTAQNKRTNRSGGTESVRTRARKTLAKLDRMFENPRWTASLIPARGKFGAVTAELLLDDPQHTRLPIADDEIVDRARALQDLTGRDVHVATFDTGMALRARTAGLPAHKLNNADPDETAAAQPTPSRTR